MKYDLEPRGWIVAEETFDPCRTAKCESIFAQGNGYINIRCALEEGQRGRCRARENRDGAVFTLRLPLPDKLNLSAVRPDETHLSPALIHYELALTLARRAGKNAPDFSLF